jgi:tetratricopeptide (TPR) repeat protein
MTIAHIVLTATFVLAAAGASAQPPAPVPPVLPAPLVQVSPVPLEAPPVTPGDISKQKLSTADVARLLSRAQIEKNEKKAVSVTAIKREPFALFAEPGAPDALYSQARSWIDRNQYDRALEPLEKVIDARGSRADGAMYWKAYSLWKLARRDDALATLGQLAKLHPASRWLGDARALEVEVKQAAGQSVATTAADDDVKLLALNGIMRTDPEAALPVVERMLAGSGNVRLKERALFVLSQNRSDRAREIIASVAKGTSNPDLQLLAIRYLGVSNSPESIAMLTTIYRGDSSIDTKKAIITALASAPNANTVATSAMVTLARAERNPELRTTLVRHLSTSTTPEARAYMLELLK